MAPHPDPQCLETLGKKKCKGVIRHNIGTGQMECDNGHVFVLNDWIVGKRTKAEKPEPSPGFEQVYQNRKDLSI